MRVLPKIALFVAVLCLAVAAKGQVTVISGQAVDQFGQPVAFAQVRVCSVTSIGTPCTPTATVYTNYSLTGTPASNPYSADQYGNYTLYAGPLAAPNLYVVQLAPASGITWSYIIPGQTCGPSGCTISGPVTATLFNATQSPYYEINGTQITSAALSDHANIAYLNAANTFSVSPQTASIFNATTQFNVAGSQISSANLSDSANLAKLNASNTFTGATNTFATVNATGYQVSGVALAASNLSNGVSGTGAVCLASGSACSGTVSSFAAPSGSWPAWLVPTVTNSMTTPSLAVAASAIPNSALQYSSTTVDGVSCALGGTCNTGPTFTGGSGYQVLPSGLTMAFGSSTYTGSAVTVSFTPNFAHAVFSIVLTGQYESGTYGVSRPQLVYGTQTASSFQWTSDENPTYVNWVAIGW